MNRLFLSRLTIVLLAGLLASCGDSTSKTAPSAASESAPLQKKPSEGAGKGNEGADSHGGHEEHKEEGAVVLSAEEASAEGIKSEAVEYRAVSAAIQLTAAIVANRDRLAHIAPRVTGKLVRVHTNLGERVSAGKVLAHVDSIEIGSANSEYLQARSAADLARANGVRSEKLYAEQVISQKDYLAARSEVERTDAALRAARDRLRTLGVGLPQPGGPAPSIYPLTAPFAGTIIAKDAVLGELAQPDKPVFSIADLTSVWIEADLFEKDLARVRVGAKASVVVNAYPDQRFPGALTYISDTVDPQTRTLKARIEVPNPEGRLKPGMFATAHLDTDAAQEALAVPADAVVLLDGKSSVFVEENGRYLPRAVTLGAGSGTLVPVIEGLSPGDSVAVAGVYALKARLLKSKIGEGHSH